MAFLKTKELWLLSLYLPNIELEQAGFAFAGLCGGAGPGSSGILSDRTTWSRELSLRR